MTEAPWEKPLIALVDDGSSMDDVSDSVSMEENMDNDDVHVGTPLYGSATGDVDPEPETPSDIQEQTQAPTHSQQQQHPETETDTYTETGSETQTQYRPRRIYRHCVTV
jgi:TATA-binding protein-associated factor Taf7